MKQLWGIRTSHILLLLAAILLSVTTFILATIPLFLLRVGLGSSRYLILVGPVALALIAAQKYSLWIPFVIVCALVFLYQQARDLDCNLVQSGLVSILGTSGITAFCLGLYVQITEVDLIRLAEEKTLAFVNSLQSMQPGVTIEVDKIVAQIPSAIIMIFLLALWIGLLGMRYLSSKRRFDRLTGLDSAKWQRIFKTKLSDFQLPNFVVWIALPVIAATFIDFDLLELKMIAGNLLNILLVLYFFHGLSIIAVFFRAYEVGVFWQVFWYVILTVHMFLLVSSLGFADFWMNFRSKIKKKPAKTA